MAGGDHTYPCAEARLVPFSRTGQTPGHPCGGMVHCVTLMGRGHMPVQVGGSRAEQQTAARVWWRVGPIPCPGVPAGEGGGRRVSAVKVVTGQVDSAKPACVHGRAGPLGRRCRKVVASCPGVARTVHVGLPFGRGDLVGA